MTITLRVFIKSEGQTLHAADMDTIGHPVCTGTNSTDWGSVAGKADRAIPEEQRILLDAASRAAEKLACGIEVIDVSNYGFIQKRRLKGTIPRIEIGEQILTGLPTSDEIVQYCQ